MISNLKHLGNIDNFTYSPRYKKNNVVLQCKGANIRTSENPNYLHLKIIEHPSYSDAEIQVRKKKKINMDILYPFDLKVALVSHNNSEWSLRMLEDEIQKVEIFMGERTETLPFTHKLNYAFSQSLAKTLLSSSIEIPSLFEERLQALIDDTDLKLFEEARKEKKFK